MGTARASNEKSAAGIMTDDETERKGTKRKQERTDRGKVLKSRLLGLQTVQAEMDGNSDWLVERPGVRTRAMCRQEERAKDMLLSNQDTAGDSGPRGIGQTAQVHHSTQNGMAYIALEWCYQDLRASGRGNNQVQ